MDARMGVQLPLVQRVHLSHFTLYRNKTENSVDLGNGVFCLVGANGLGKSTFLSLINYALTGIVAPSDPKILSIAEYYDNNLAYSGEYFTGRVGERDREIAQVTLDFSIGEFVYTVTRGMFSPKGLRRLTVSGPGVSFDKHVDAEDVAASNELHAAYVDFVLQHAGLSHFAQLVFLQHFLLTFDERRHLLFWDPEVARFALYLVFGMDPAQAAQAGDWQRKADKLESQARNAQYQATTARERRKELLDRAETPFESDLDLEEQHERLQQRKDDLAERVAEKVAQEKDARLQLGVAVAEQHALTVEYNRLFAERINPRSAPSLHPLLSRLLADAHCGMCGSDEVDVTAVQALLDESSCPLCRSSIEAPSSDSGQFDKLERIDEQLQRSNRKVLDLQHSLERVEAELATLRQQYHDCDDSLAAFEEQNSEYFLSRESADNSSSLMQLAHQLEAEQQDAIRRRDEFRRRRDECKSLLEPLQRELAEKYALAEREFLPKFQSLAHAFLGLDLTLVLEQRARGPQLVISIDEKVRREPNQLSESQRYFIDIALRMALAEFMVPDGSGACLFIDTPEGSLDIAYERRAGEMFGQFVQRGNRLVMTANLNASRLVLELAETCRRDKMHVERMTNWAVLSEVQADAEDLFDESYDRIERHLDGVAR